MAAPFLTFQPADSSGLFLGTKPTGVAPIGQHHGHSYPSFLLRQSTEPSDLARSSRLRMAGSHKIGDFLRGGTPPGRHRAASPNGTTERPPSLPSPGKRTESNKFNPAPAARHLPPLHLLAQTTVYADKPSHTRQQGWPDASQSKASNCQSEQLPDWPSA